MDWNYIKRFHLNPPIEQLYRRQDVQSDYDKYKLSENDLKAKLFKRGEIWVMTKNKFPYDFIDDTQHYVIWFRQKINYKLIKFLLRDYDDVVYFENHQNNKSILSIPHVHIFLKSN